MRTEGLSAYECKESDHGTKLQDECDERELSSLCVVCFLCMHCGMEKHYQSRHLYFEEDAISFDQGPVLHTTIKPILGIPVCV